MSRDPGSPYETEVLCQAGVASPSDTFAHPFLVS